MTERAILHIDINNFYASVCRAASTKVGGCGMRYTVRIEGKETYLFEEDGKWFIEEEYIKEV